eukprot:symbB.v1.2.017832.t1/scaffold1396.1/size121868/2
MVEVLKSDSTPSRPASKKNEDNPKGHKVIELPAHLIRVLIGKAGSTIREVISRTSWDDITEMKPIVVCHASLGQGLISKSTTCRTSLKGVFLWLETLRELRL